MGKFSGNGTRIEIKHYIQTFCTKVSVDIWKFPNTQYSRDKVALSEDHMHQK